MKRKEKERERKKDRKTERQKDRKRERKKGRKRELALFLSQTHESTITFSLSYVHPK